MVSQNEARARTPQAGHFTHTLRRFPFGGAGMVGAAQAGQGVLIIFMGFPVSFAVLAVF